MAAEQVGRGLGTHYRGQVACGHGRAVYDLGLVVWQDAEIVKKKL